MPKITLLQGDGIGPEIANSVKTIIDASGANLEWDIVDAGQKQIEKYGQPLPPHVIENIKESKIALKGPITTPVGGGFRSVNVQLRLELDLYVNLRPVKSLPGIKTRYEDVDLVIVRENTEDLYVGIEHKIGDMAAEAIKLITTEGSRRISRFAFDYAQKNGRKKVTAVHKANILKLTDGLFLRCADEISKDYKDILFENVIVDNMCMQLVQNPDRFDVLVMPNLYGDILSDLCAGFVGGLGIVPGANIGKDFAVFEAVHGSAPDIAGQNKANPTALLQSGIMMLNFINKKESADKIFKALVKVMSSDKKALTPDLGGENTTTGFTELICKNL